MADAEDVAIFAFLNYQQQLLTEQLILHRRRERRNRRRRRPRTVWVREWLTEKSREAYGHYAILMQQLRENDAPAFRNFTRMDPELFDEIVTRVSPHISKQDTNYRKSISPGLKVAVTLRHLATGDKYPSLSYSFRVHKSTICLFLPEVLRAIRDEYLDEVMQCPNTPEGWREVSKVFEKRWNIPHAVGALDGKHVAIQAPSNSGSIYHNYKGFFSIVLLALVDGDYKFLWADTGANGSASDAQIFNHSELRKALEQKTLGLPEPDNLPNDDRPFPYFVLSDDAFALRSYMMKPFSNRNLTLEEAIANYRISRGRRVVENAFGIMAMRWAILLTTMMHDPETVRLIVETCVVLHNLLRIRRPAEQNHLVDQEDQEGNIIPGQWRQFVDMTSVERAWGPNAATKEAKKYREYLKLYINSEAGQVEWQRRMVQHAGN